MNITQKVLFWLILAAGLFFRIHDLGRASYQIDEINVVQFALQEEGLLTAYQTELDRFLFMHRLPLLMIVLHAAIAWFHDAAAGFPPEFIARLPLTLIGLLSLPLFFGLGRRLGGPATGLWVMVMAAFSPFHVFYSREAYDYSMLLAFSAGVLWSGLELLHGWRMENRLRPRWAAVFNLFAVALLHAHLSGLVFLAMWCAVLGVIVLAHPATRRLNRLLPALAVLGLPFFFFLPFLFKLLAGGWVDHDSGEQIRRITWTILPELLGRLGWGENGWALLPFIAALAFGIRKLLGGSGGGRVMGRALLVNLVVVSIVQAWLLRVARFEIRYFAAIQPALLVFAGVGWAALRESAVRRSPRAGGLLAAAATLALVGWLGANSWLVTQLQCRGSNFKELARWLAGNLPENGIYCFWNGYEMRGVPAVYPTPGRHATFPVTWSTPQDYSRFQARERMISLFQRFPTAAYVEYWPSDVLAPSIPHNPPVPRAELFVNQLWLKDPAYQRMAAWGTLPLGDTQWNNRFMDHILVSYNRAQDLPELARRRGQTLYHYFGNDWSFAKDRQMNDWLVTPTAATLMVGNLSDGVAETRLRLFAMAAPRGGRINVYGPGGRLLENAEIGSQPRELVLDRLRVGPGETRLFIEILPPPGGVEATLHVHGVGIESLPADAQPK